MTAGPGDEAESEPGPRVLVRFGARELAGAVHRGESWSAAARRTTAAIAGSVPEAVDLSGPVKRFIVDHDCAVTVRAGTRGDLPALTRWRQAEHVHRWWRADGEPTPEAVAGQYGPDLDAITPTRLWISEVNGRSVGFVQDYRIGDYPEYALLAPDPDAIGVDYAIGDPAWIGKGLGARALWAWLAKARHRFPEARYVFAAPSHRNEASLRMLDKLGFDRGVWFDQRRADGTVDTLVGCTLDLRRVVG